jgi:glucokinase
MTLVGLDIGGTNLKAVHVARDGTLLRSVGVAAGGRIAREALLERAAEAVAEVADGAAVGGVGIAVGGALQPDGTMRLGSTNLPNLADVPLAPLFSERLGIACRFDHDGRSAMRGEAWMGAARGLRHAMMLTFGTGIGAGLLLDGAIRQGAHLGAGEIGLWRLAMPLDPDGEVVFEDRAAPAKLPGWSGHGFDSLYRGAPADPKIGAVRDAIIDLVGKAIANAHLLLDLEATILSGGVTAIGEAFRADVEAAWRRACPAEFRHGLSIRLSTLGPLAGAYGAAALWLQERPS